MLGKRIKQTLALLTSGECCGGRCNKIRQITKAAAAHPFRVTKNIQVPGTWIFLPNSYEGLLIFWISSDSCVNTPVSVSSLA